MDCSLKNSCNLMGRVKELEEQVQQLRTSRRVLLNLLEKVHQEKTELANKLASSGQREIKIIKVNFNNK